MTGEEQESNSQDKKENTDIPSQVLINDHSEKAPANEIGRNENKWYNKLFECVKKRWVLGWSTFVVAFLVLLVTWGLFDESSKQTEIAIQNIEISKDIANRQLRPYLTVIKPQLERGNPDSLTIGEPIEMSYIVRNDGQTPAYEIKDSVHIQILLFKNRPETIPDTVRNFYYPVYSPGVSQTRKIHSGKQVLLQKHIDGFNNKKGSEDFRIFFWGRIEYTDIFNKTNWTEFCYQYIFHKPIREFRTYGTCNNADRN